MDGKAGNPCAIYPPLTVQASPEEIKRAADVLPVAPGVSQLAEQCARALYRAYMAAWQEARRKYGARSQDFQGHKKASAGFADPKKVPGLFPDL